MSKVKSILISFFAVLVVFCFVATTDAAKGGGGCKDRDNDGYFQKAGCGTAVDCNDDDAVINPGAAEVCDGIDNNCDGTVDEGCGGCIDNDGDSYGINGDPSCPAGTEIDCDDNNAGINPGASEVCGNSIDEDCDGFDDVCPGCTDNDGDGYGEGEDCLGPDCDDTDSSVNPGVSEVCDDNIDNNCDGTVDEDCGGCIPTASKERDCDCFDNTDNDCDGSIDSLDRDCKRQTCDTCFDDDGDGWYSCGGDCDDSNPAINPGASEACNGIDDNCDGLLSPEEQDADGDGWIDCEECDDTDPAINPGAPEVCNGIDDNCDGILPPEEQDADADGYMICAGDCNDTNPDERPGLTYIDNPAYCSDGLDNNCDFQVDTGPECPPPPCTDLDGDGYGANGDPSCPNGTEVDCNDFDPNVNPGAPEEPLPHIPEIPGLCEDGIDNDCDGYIDLADPGCQLPSCIDSDGDGFGVNGDPSCTYPGIIDCDDTNPTINPFAPENCGNGLDDNCDGEADGTTPGGQDMCCLDNDLDGFPGQSYCGPLVDCNDADPNINPAMPEDCTDGIDNNCDGEVDGTTPGGMDMCCLDNDLDGFPGQSYCGPFVDCNDADPNINPAMPEDCTDGIDNNCDGEVDGTTPGGMDMCCLDNDLDGFPGQSYCGPFVDCNDADPNINPAMPEDCTDGIDNNCDGEVDGTTPGGMDMCCLDNDLDGFPGQSYCGPFVDCNDADPNINPAMPEDCTDGIDNNCDGEADGTTPGGDDMCCLDNDMDGWPGQSYCGPLVDCNDADPNINPAMPEDCTDGIDNNCDGEADGTTPGGDDMCCLDNDLDGYYGQVYCGPNVDCDDNNPLRSPGILEGPFGSPECSDGLDNDCDDLVDAADPECDFPCIDSDGDGYGVNGDPTCPNGAATDCNDNDPAIYPGADDSICNGVDQDCDGIPDDEYVPHTLPCLIPPCPECQCIDGTEICSPPSCDPEGPAGDPTCADGLDNDCDGDIDEADNDCADPICDPDGDGWCDCPGCLGPDCDDYDPDTYPGAPLICDGKDNNCDGMLDFPDDIDADGDGVPACAECDDNDPNRSPDIVEGPFGDPTCADGIDNDCDGLTDAEDPDCAIADAPHNMIFDCTVCHDPGTYVLNAAIPNSKCEQCHTPSGSLKPGYPTAPDVMTHYSNIYIDPTTGVLVDIDCVECHNPMRPQTNLAHIRGIIRGIPVVFTAYTGLDSFADGFPPFNGICEVCHTQTMHHQNDGTAPGGQNHNDGQDCTACHTHENGFVGIVECFGPHDTVFDCAVCHDPGTYIPNAPIPNEKCDACHTPGGALKAGYPTAPDVETHQGNSFSFSLDCVECHTDHCNSNNLKLVRSTIAGTIFPGSQIEFTAYTGPGSFADGPPYEENICNTCHTMTNHHQVDGTAPGGQDHNTGNDCTSCHSHLPNGFFPTF